MKKGVPKVFLLMAFSIILSSPPPLYANDQEIPYPVRIPYRMVRGVVNIGLGWTEIFLRPFGERKTETLGEAISLGAAHTLIRWGVGVTDITTFWVPDIQMLELYPDWQGWPYLFHWS